MSTDATRWAWTAPVETSTQRLVLLSLADRAGEQHTAWPSIERLSKDTALNEKTVQKVILELIGLGLVIDTGDRMGPTKRVRVLKLIGVMGRYDSPSQQNQHAKQPQKRNDSKKGNVPNIGILNDPKNGILNDPNFGVQNLTMNLTMNLSCEHEWVPDKNALITKLKIAGQERNLELILGLPSFEFELSAFNSYFDGHVMSESKKLHKFTSWIIDKFERHQKSHPDYYRAAKKSHTNEGTSIPQPLINLDSKPKSLLGGDL